MRIKISADKIPLYTAFILNEEAEAQSAVVEEPLHSRRQLYRKGILPQQLTARPQPSYPYSEREGRLQSAERAVPT